jgi:hypothetical protein
MTSLPPEIEKLETYQRARLAAETLTREMVNAEVDGMSNALNDLVYGANALSTVMGEIEGGHDQLIRAASFMAQRLEALASDLCNSHVEIANKLHYWAEIEEPKP